MFGHCFFHSRMLERMWCVLSAKLICCGGEWDYTKYDLFVCYFLIVQVLSVNGAQCRGDPWWSLFCCRAHRYTSDVVYGTRNRGRHSKRVLIQRNESYLRMRIEWRVHMKNKVIANRMRRHGVRFVLCRSKTLLKLRVTQSTAGSFSVNA